MSDQHQERKEGRIETELELQLKLTQTINEANERIPLTKDLLSTTTDERAHKQSTNSKKAADDKTPLINKIALYNQSDERYQTGELLGSGGGGSVYDLIDHNLKRTIAAKFLSEEQSQKEKSVRKFIREAHLTSHLEHPNIPPIYDLGIEDHDRLFYTMKKIQGVPLSSIINNNLDNSDMAKDIIAKCNNTAEIISIFIKSCEALSYAHHHGIIHRDIKPDNIMIGAFGEVYIVDWGIAYNKATENTNHNRLVGTPLYMSPEQARKEGSDERSDIYCLGTTFFHALFRQYPLIATDTDTFWEQKRKGELSEIDPGHAKDIPKPLAAICQKCLQPKAEDRYQDIDSLISDLKTFQNGGLVSAYRYSAIDLIKYHSKHSAKHIVWFTLSAILLGAAAFGAFQFYQRGVSTWGDPVYSESFSDPEAWKQHWELSKNTKELRVENQRLVTKGGTEFMWFYNKSFRGGVAIEFEGEMINDSRAGDLSIAYTTNLNTLDEVYYLQHAAVENTCSIIDGPDGRLEYKPVQLESGRVYKIRGEIDGKKLSLYLDGKLTCEYELLFPLNSGYIGLYGYYENKAFDNIRIYNKELPVVTDITKTGDLLFENEKYSLAIERYKKIYETHKGTKSGVESLYKLGLCHYKLGEVDDALDIWQGVDDPKYNNQINQVKWRRLYQERDHDSIFKQMGAALRNNREPRQIIHEWSHYLRKATQKGDLQLIDRFLTFREKHFPDDQVYARDVFDALKVKGNSDKALVMFPEQDHIVILALLESGRYNDIIEKYPLRTGSVAQALVSQGEFDQIIEHYSDIRPPYLAALIESGRISEAETVFADNQDILDNITILGRGDPQAVVERAEKGSGPWLSAQLALGNEEAFLDGASIRPLARLRYNYDVTMSLLLKRYYQNDKKALEEMQKVVFNTPGELRSTPTCIFNVYFIYPLLMLQEGKGEMASAFITHIKNNLKRSQGMRTWYNCKLMLGEIAKNEFMNQPYKRFIEHDFYLYSAIHNKFKGRKRLALKQFRQHKQLAPYKKYISATIKRFVDHNIAELSK